MHKEFSGWYASLSLGEDAEYLAKRWELVTAATEDTAREDMARLVQIAFGLKTTEAEISALRSQFTGPLSPPGDRELALLAAAALVYDMEEEFSDAGYVASLLVSTWCFGQRSLDQPMDLIGLGENTLRRLSETSRRRPELEVKKVPRANLAATEVGAAMKLAQDGHLGEALKSLASSTNKLLTAIVRRQNQFEADVKTFVSVQDEELDMLWWLHGGRSLDLDVPFCEVPVELRSFVIARELARMTKVLPGPTALTSLLSRARVQDAPRQSIADAVQGMDFKWISEALAELPEGRISRHPMPILFAFVRRAEIDGAEGWVPSWAPLVGVVPNAELSPMQLAEALYRELVLARLG